MRCIVLQSTSTGVSLCTIVLFAAEEWMKKEDDASPLSSNHFRQALLLEVGFLYCTWQIIPVEALDPAVVDNEP